MQYAGPSEKVEVSKLVNGESWGRERPRDLVGLFFFFDNSGTSHERR